MRFAPATLVRTLAALVACAGLAPAQAAGWSTRGEASWTPATAKSHRAAEALGPTADIELPAPRPEQLKAIAAPQAGIALAIGVPLSISPVASVEAARALRWIPTPSGGLAARVRLRAASAAALRAAFSLPGARAGTRVRFIDGAGDVAATLEHGAPGNLSRLTWSPITRGTEQVLEIELARGASPYGIAFSLEAVSHLVVDPASPASNPSLAKAAGSCQVDAACAAAPDEALQRAMRSVVKVAYTVGGTTYACTGTLVSDDDASSQEPFVLTARHCIDSAAAARTVNTFWFLEASRCGGPTSDRALQLTAGAELTYAGESSDIALIRLNEPAPANAWFSGIEASALAAGDAATALHHPRGDLKRLSSGVVVNPAEGSVGQYVSVGWLSGTTEPGSSGSALFTRSGEEYVVRGTLRGGSASCGNSGALQDPANRDFYSRLDVDAQPLAAAIKSADAPAASYTDLWMPVGAPGSGVSIVQNAAGQMFVVWFDYDAEGRPTWLTVPGGRWTAPGTFEGAVFRSTRRDGVVSSSAIGSAALRFTGEDEGVLTLHVSGAAPRAIAIGRFAF